MSSHALILAHDISVPLMTLSNGRQAVNVR